MAALREEGTLVEVAQRFGVHHTQVGKWKALLEKESLALFESSRDPKNKDQDAQIRVLHEKIGRLTVERDFLAPTIEPCASMRFAGFEQVWPLLSGENILSQ